MTQILELTATTTLTREQSGAIITDSGAAGAPETRPVYLPYAEPPIEFTFHSISGNGLRIIPRSGQTIRLGSQVGKSGGYLQAQASGDDGKEGDRFTLRCVAQGKWISDVPAGLLKLETS